MTEPKPTADDIRREIEKTRADLAATADALSAKFDVKGQAKRKTTEVKQSVGDAAAAAKNSAPAPVQQAVDRTTSAVAPVVQRAEPYRRQLAIAAAVGVVVAVIVRRRSRH